MSSSFERPSEALLANPRLLIAASVFPLALGALITWSPLASVVVVALVISVLVTAFAPLLAVSGLVIFLLLQEPLQILAGNDTALAQVVQYSDETLILLIAVTRAFSSPDTVARVFLPPLRWSLALCYASLVLSTALNGRLSVAVIIDLLLFSKPFLLLLIGGSLLKLAPGRDPAPVRLVPVLFLTQLPALLFMSAPELHASYLGDFRNPDERLGLPSATGLFFNPGTFGWVSVATFCLSYAAFLAFARKKYILFALGSAIFAVLSWRRKSIGGIFAVLVVSLLVQGRGRQRMRTLAALLLAATAVLVVLVPFASALWERTVSEYGSTDPLSTARSALYYGSVLIARDHFPLGTGFATYGSHASVLAESRVYLEYGISRSLGWGGRELRFVTDTYWPMVLGQGGVLGLLGILLFFGSCLVATWRAAILPAQDAPDRFVTMGALFTLVASFFEALASHVYGASLSSALVMVPLGLFLASSSRFARADRSRMLSGSPHT